MIGPLALDEIRAPFPADPKDKLDVLKLAQLAESFELDGRYLEAKAAYAHLLELVPGSPASYVNLALCEARVREFDEAIATLRRKLQAGDRHQPYADRLSQPRRGPEKGRRRSGRGRGPAPVSGRS